tara:strand:+ start:148 stop:390 length:243 start_codon:yes stop_codon:yes gene_type:complete
MAKGIWKEAGPEDRIFNGKFVLSSQKATTNSAGPKPDPSVSLKGEALVTSLMMSDERLRELGLDTRDQLVIFDNSTRRKE